MKNLKFIIYNVRSDTDFSSNYITKLESVAYIKVSRDLESRILSEKILWDPRGQEVQHPQFLLQLALG